MAERTSDDFYELFGVAPDVDDAELRRAFHRLAGKWHPDRAGADVTFIFQRIAAAYAVLSDPVARASYDRSRGITPRPPPRPADPPPPEPIRRRAPGILIRRLSSPLNILLASRIARYADDGVIELDIEPDEAAIGGMATIPMRVLVRRDDGSRSEELFAAWLAVPPDVADGTVLRPSVLLPGMIDVVVFRIRRR